MTGAYTSEHLTIWTNGRKQVVAIDTDMDNLDWAVDKASQYDGQPLHQIGAPEDIGDGWLRLRLCAEGE